MHAWSNGPSGGAKSIFPDLYSERLGFLVEMASLESKRVLERALGRKSTPKNNTLVESKWRRLGYIWSGKYLFKRRGLLP